MFGLSSTVLACLLEWQHTRHSVQRGFSARQWRSTDQCHNSSEWCPTDTSVTHSPATGAAGRWTSKENKESFFIWTKMNACLLAFFINANFTHFTAKTKASLLQTSNNFLTANSFCYTTVVIYIAFKWFFFQMQLKSNFFWKISKVIHSNLFFLHRSMRFRQSNDKQKDCAVCFEVCLKFCFFFVFFSHFASI